MEDVWQDDLADARLLSPIDYGKLRGIRPQRVYAALRSGRLAVVKCNCGRKCVEVEAADKLFGLGSHLQVQGEEE